MISYQEQLTKKVIFLTDQLTPYTSEKIKVFPSPEKHFRMRAEFRIWHDDNGIHYAMAPRGKSINSDNIIMLNDFPIAYGEINRLMPLIKDALQESAILKTKLFQIEFLSSLSKENVITLIYHQQLNDDWQEAAKQLAKKLNISIIGRSRKQKIIIGSDYVKEKLRIFDEDYYYHQYEQSFSQPNATVCQKMIEWACQETQKHERKDLLELYCGNGNFTIPMSQYFDKVFATEISKSGIKALKENIQLNKSRNIKVARLSAEEFTSAFNQERHFRRLAQADVDLNDYQFSTVFVDPPRAGIDSDTLKLLRHFEQIIYISCNPETLVDNLSQLSKTHHIESAALFDQFPFTNHIESGVFLRKREVS